MHILLTNDDGVFAPALWALRESLLRLGRVTVVAPRTEQSGVGHAITYLAPITAERVRVQGDAEAYAISGTPADCVKFALLELLSEPPELVVSGINLGYNVGHYVFYSGTVAAAVEGAMNGIRSVAFSTAGSNAGDLSAIAAQALRVLKVILERSPREADGALAYNVNLPELPGPSQGDPRILFTHHKASAFPERYVKEETQGAVAYQLDIPWREVTSSEEGCDVHVVQAGMISVTPLRATLTDLDSLRALDSREGSGPGEEGSEPRPRT